VSESKKQWVFEAIDTWFFREMRPIDELTGAELGSLFPPPARTIAGAVRGLIGEQTGINWAAYRKGEGRTASGIDLCEQIGDPRCEKGEAEFGKLRLTGPYLLKDNQRLYPVPQHLLQDEQGAFYWLEPDDDPVCCDLGKVRLPVVQPKTEEKIKPLGNAWVDKVGLQAILSGKTPNYIYSKNELFVNETRIGIGLNRDNRMTIEGLLYQTSHIRPCENVALGVEVAGIDECLQLLSKETYTVRLGGEGRIASVNVGAAEELPETAVTNETKNIVLVLLTPLLVPEKGSFFMPFPRTEKKGQEKKGDKGKYDVWHVSLKDVKLEIISAVLGKPQREGGWNLAKNQSRPLRNLVPSGSVWFCRVLSGNPKNLHGHKIGEETALGRGELAVGYWSDDAQ
jgi:CRISPR-associated protein Cmr3